MNRVGYYLLVAAMAFFAGVVGASTINVEEQLPSTDQVLSYFNSAHSQEQAY